VTRLIAFAVDAMVVTVLFSLAVAGFNLVADLVVSGRAPSDGENGLIWFIAFAVWAFLYSSISLAIAGRTPGKSLIGLRVVTRTGGPMTPRQAIVRTLTLPVSFAILGLGLLGIVVGKEHRALHDVFAGTAVVYDWGDRPAELPTPLSRFLTRKGALAEDGVEVIAIPDGRRS
jgi:uncharacterized RDD family membrane protein YckC